MALLEIRDLQLGIKVRGRTAYPVDGVNLCVDSGESVGIVGESGSGKTLTALSVMGLLPTGARVTRGDIAFQGRDLADLGAKGYRSIRGDSVGMIFQDPLSSLNPTMKIGAQVAAPLRLHRKLRRSEARVAAIEELARVGIPQPHRRADLYPHQLSGGMRQRVMIAIALICSPALLIADEPTTALDVTIQQQILDLIDDIRRATQMSVVLVSHDLGVVAGRTDRVAVMYSGRVVEYGPTAEVLSRPAHPYTTALLAAMPERAIESGARLSPIPGEPPDPLERPAGCAFAARCRWATEICLTVDPVAHPVGPEHTVACHHPINSAATASAGPFEASVSGKADPPIKSRASAAVRDKAVELEGVSVDFPFSSAVFWGKETVSAVSDVSFAVEEGTTLGLVGESGCGKSTLGRLIAGIELPTTGSVMIGQKQFGTSRGMAARQLRRDVQLMYQDSYASLDPRMKVGDLLREPLVIQRVGDRRSQRVRVAQLLASVGLGTTMLDRLPHELSGGQRQRIALARALALDPKVLVADEPVSALDVSIQAQLLNLMKDLQQKLDTTYIFISHDLNVVSYMASKIAVVYLGKLVEFGNAADVRGRPMHPYTNGLIAAIPDVQGRPMPESAKIHGDLPSAMHPPSGCRFRTRCPLAQPVCGEVTPQLARADDDEQFVACHFPIRHHAA